MYLLIIFNLLLNLTFTVTRRIGKPQNGFEELGVWLKDVVVEPVVGVVQPVVGSVFTWIQDVTNHRVVILLAVLSRIQYPIFCDLSKMDAV
jgi:hypothetical protein